MNNHKEVTIADAPACLNTHDRAMWVLGWNECLAKYAAPLGPLTLSLSPDPRGVHVAVHQGSECVHNEAMEVPGVGQGVPDDLRAGVLSEIRVFSGKRPEEGETWESWYEAAFDMVLVKIKAMLAASPTPPAGEEQEPVGSVFTMEALVPGGEVKCHATLTVPLPAGTKLYANPAPQAAQGETLLVASEAIRNAILCGNKHAGGLASGLEALAREKGVLPTQPAQDEREPVAWAATDEDGKVEALGMNQSRRFDTPLYTRAALSTPPMEGDEDTPVWIGCESRRPFVVNSLKAEAEEMRAREKRCRSAYRQDFMGIPTRYVADAYGEAAAIFERRLSAIAAMGKGGEQS